MNDFNQFWNNEAERRRKLWTARYTAIRRRCLFDDQANVNEMIFASNLNKDELMRLHSRHICASNPIISSSDPRMYSEHRLSQRLAQLGADTSTLHLTVAVTHNNNKVQETAIVCLADAAIRICKTITVSKPYDPLYVVEPFYGHSKGDFNSNPFHKMTLVYDAGHFGFLDTATLLIEMAADYRLRNEEIAYYHKRRRMDSIKAAVATNIKFKLWDDEKLRCRLHAYHQKGYSEMQMLRQVTVPWRRACRQLMGLVAMADPEDIWHRVDDSVYAALRTSVCQIDPDGLVSDDKNGFVRIVCNGYTYFIRSYRTFASPSGLMVLFRPLSDYPLLELKFEAFSTKALALYVSGAGRFNRRLNRFLRKACRMYRSMLTEVSDNTDTSLQSS